MHCCQNPAWKRMEKLKFEKFSTALDPLSQGLKLVACSPHVTLED